MSAGLPTRTVFLRRVVLPARIGVYASEQNGPQRIQLTLSFEVADPGGVGVDELARVVDYGGVLQTARQIVTKGHVFLVETLAERIAEAVLHDPRILAVRVEVEKLDILPEGATAGVVVTRAR